MMDAIKKKETSGHMHPLCQTQHSLTHLLSAALLTVCSGKNCVTVNADKIQEYTPSTVPPQNTVWHTATHTPEGWPTGCVAGVHYEGRYMTVLPLPGSAPAWVVVGEGEGVGVAGGLSTITGVGTKPGGWGWGWGGRFLMM